jgi:hypothetical protein
VLVCFPESYVVRLSRVAHLKRTVISAEALRSTNLLIFPLDVPTLLAVENGVAACGLFVSFRCAPGLPRRSMYENREGGRRVTRLAKLSLPFVFGHCLPAAADGDRFMKLFR